MKNSKAHSSTTSAKAGTSIIEAIPPKQQIRRNAIISTPTSNVSKQRQRQVSLDTFFTSLAEHAQSALEDARDVIETASSEVSENPYEEDLQDFDIPPEINLTKEEVLKYFGKISRKKFFEQLTLLQNQKNILGWKHTDPLSVDLLRLLNKIEDERKKEDSIEEALCSPVKFDTKIIIRTQSLNPSELYDQMRIIQRPSSLAAVQEDEVMDAALSQQSNQSTSSSVPGNSSSAAARSAIVNDAPPNLAKDNQFPRKNSFSNKKAPLTSPVKLKPLNLSASFTEGSANHRTPSISSPVPNSAERRPSNHRLPPLTKPPTEENEESKGRRARTSSKDSNDGIALFGIPFSPKDPVDQDATKEQTPREETEESKESESIILSPLGSPAALPRSKLEFVCVDYRDGFNQKVNDRLKKNNSLFKYVESKQLKRDFYDDYADETAIEQELHLLKHHNLSAVVASEPVSARKGSNGSKTSTVTRSKQGGASTTPPPSRGADKIDGSLSPRSQYIDNCIRHRLNPRAGLILRKRFTRELNLKHLGMGDQMALLLAEAIVNVPYIRSLNVRDNNLNDAGLAAIVNSIESMKDLVELDMSYNMIGPSAASALNNFLSNPSCPLKRLILQKADVDDDECRDFVSALETNTCLEELDLSENLVGSSENLNTVMPDLTTGGEALADLLKTPTCPLTSLKLGWNLIRLDGAVTLCESLAFNNSLTHLDLSFNSLSSGGGKALGDAMQDNKVLKTLIVSNNNLDSVACLTICAGIFQNEALESVSFNENPIGEQGAKVLMLLPTIIGSRVHVIARNCNLQIKDPKNWFDSSMLVREYTLELDNPFDRAVAIILSYLIPAHQTYIIARSEYYDPETKKWVDIRLSEAVDTEYYKKRPLSAEQMKVIEGLQRIQAATADVGKAVELFKMVDEDGSGELDAEEFAKLIEAVGMDPSKSSEIMAEYDVDGGGVIEIAEFLLFLKTQRKESKQRLTELTEYPILYSALDYPDEKNNKVRYVPPRKGQLKLSIIDGFTQKPTYRVISPEDRTNILKVAEESGDLLTMTSFGVKNYKIRLYEALSLASSLMKDSDKVQVLGTVLPQMAQSQEAKLLVSRIIDNNITDLTRLKRLIGQFYRVIMGTPDGYYSLDLSSEMDRCCVNRLLEISMTMKHFRSSKRNVLGYGKLGDTSQKKNFTCFRNEMLNRRGVTVTTDFASPLPRAGRLEFDFVCQKRYSSDSFIINDVRFTNLLMKTFQLAKSDRIKVLKLLQHTKKQCNRTVYGNAKRIYEIPKEKALEIGLAMETFYEKLSERLESIERYRSKENVKAIWEFDPNKIQLRVNNFHRIYSIPSFPESKYHLIMRPQQNDAKSGKGKGAKNASSGKKEENEEEFVFSSEDEEDEEGEEEEDEEIEQKEDEEIDEAEEDTMEELFRQQIPVIEKPSVENAALAVINIQHIERANHLKVTLGTEDRPVSAHIVAEAVSSISSKPQSKQATSRLSRAKSKRQAALSETLNRYVCLMGSRNIPNPTKAVKTLELLIDTFETVSLMMRHLEIIVILFEGLGSLQNSDYFGTYRVELIIQLFSNVVDVYNIELLYRHLSTFEIACLNCRLGYLNLFNPMKPEGSFSFNLARHEERTVVKMLAHLAVIEPGDNLPFVQFRWERDMDCMPGYELTELWMTESGMPQKGIWDCTYYAGEGLDRNGCKPHIKCRKGLLQLVFVEEDEIMTEEDREAEKKIIPVGPQYVQANAGTFIGYLAYNEEDFEAYQEKHKGREGKKDEKGKKKK